MQRPGHAARLYEEGGFGLIELLIALTVLTIGIISLSGLFVTGNAALRRASESDTAAVLSDRLLERFRAETWDNIALSSARVGTTGQAGTAMNDSTYANDSALTGQSALAADITEANAPAGADGTAAATACAGSPTPVTCNPSRTIPDATTGETSPDGRSYRIDTYVTWGCPSNNETLGGTLGAPTCSLANSTVVPYAPVKVVTIVVRDGSSLSTVYRSSTAFDRLTGGSIPVTTAQPSGPAAGVGSNPPPVTGAPNSPTSVTFVNGGGSGSPCPCITTGNAASLSFDVELPTTSLSSDWVTVTVSDGNPLDSVTKQMTATQGYGVVHFTQVNGSSINASGLADGTITVSAAAGNASGSSSTVTTTTSKDTSPPTGLAITSPANGATSVSRTGPFSGTAGHASGDRSTVTLEFCNSTTWTSACTTTPAQTQSASVSATGTWSTSISPQLSNNAAYTMKILQQDAAGNQATSSAVGFHT